MPEETESFLHEDDIPLEEAAMRGARDLFRELGLPGGDSSDIAGYAQDPGCPGPPRRIGEFEIIRELGRGGMGQVYLARQISLGRNVALKVLSTAIDPRPEAIRRFLREAKAAGAFEHPSIVSVHEAGIHEGRPYIAMRYVEGETLAERIATAAGSSPSEAGSRTAQIPEASLLENSHAEARGRPSSDTSSGHTRRAEILRVLSVIERAARALHVAHEGKLIHRDIKPSNVMVTPDGEPVILDFGLARLDDAEFQSLTRSGDLLGTPAYMSPEQLLAQRVPLDRRTDVYSLGVTLYECLTLQKPFEAPTREILYQTILSKEPPDPRGFNPHISRDLKVVLETALEKDRDRRYQTALDFAEDLRRIREYEPIRARPAGPVVRFRRWMQRNPVVATATVALFLLLSTGLSISLLLLGWVKEERDAKVDALGQAELAADEATENLSQLYLEKASRAWEEENYQGTALFAAAAVEAGDLPRARGLLYQAKERLWATPLWTSPHGVYALSAAFSQDSRALATGTDEGVVLVWDMETGEQIEKLGEHSGSVSSLAFSRDGTRMASGSWDNTVCIWNASPFERVARLLGHSDGVLSVAFSPDGSVLASGSRDGEIIFWSVESHMPTKERLSLPEGKSDTPLEIVCVAFSHDLRMAALGSEEGSVYLADRSVQEVTCIHKHTRSIRHLTFSRDGSMLASGSDDKTIVLWNVPEGRLATPQLENMGEQKSVVWALEFSPDGTELVSGLSDGSLHSWSTATGLRVTQGFAARHEDRVRAIAFDPGGDMLATCSEDMTVRVWRTTGLGEHDGLWELAGPPDKLAVVAFGQDGSILGTISVDGTVCLWDVTTQRRLARVGSKEREPSALAVSAAGGHVAVGSRRGRLAFFSIADLEKTGPKGKPLGPITCLAFDFSGNRLASGTKAGDVFLWRPRSDREPDALRGHTQPVRSFAFSPNGRLLASGSASGRVLLWDLETLEQRQDQLETDEAIARDVKALAFSVDGQLLASGYADGLIRVWHVDSVTRRHEFRDPAEFYDPAPLVQFLAFRPDGEIVSGCSQGATLHVSLHRPDWRSAHLSLLAHERQLRTAAIDRKGGLVATGSDDRTVRLWRIESLPPLFRLDPEKLPSDAAQAEVTIEKAATSGDASTAALLCSDGEVRILDLSGSTSRELRVSGAQEKVHALAINRTGRLLAASCPDGRLLVFDLELNAKVSEVQLGAPTDALAFSPDGKLTAAAVTQKESVVIEDGAPEAKESSLLHILDTNATASAEETRILDLPNRVLTLAFNPTGDTIAAAGADQVVRLFESFGETGRDVQRSELMGHQASVKTLCFSPDGKLLASGAWDKTVRLWRLDSYTESARLEGHEGVVTAACFSPSGDWLVSASVDGTLRLWEVSTQRESAILDSTQCRILGTCFRPDGRDLILLLQSGEQPVWRLNLDRLLPPMKDVMDDARTRTGLEIDDWKPKARLVNRLSPVHSPDSN